MIFRAGMRFDEENYFLTEIDTSVPNCEVTGELDGVPVSFYGDYEEGLIIGGTVEWNQLEPNPTNYTQIFNEGTKAVNGHKYLLSFHGTMVDPGGTTPIMYWYTYDTEAQYIANVTLGADKIISSAYDAVSDGTSTQTAGNMWKWCSAPTNIDEMTFNLVDLTAMFGSDVADSIYAMEQSTAGAGVALFKKLFTADYYEFNSGTEKTITLR